MPSLTVHTLFLTAYAVGAGHDVKGRLLVCSGHRVFLSVADILLPCSAGRVRKAALSTFGPFLCSCPGRGR